MTRDEIIQIAREVLLLDARDDTTRDDGIAQFVGTLHEFANLVAAKEREACAKICEGMSARPEFGLEIQDRMLLAAAKSIRARGNQ